VRRAEEGQPEVAVRDPGRRPAQHIGRRAGRAEPGQDVSHRFGKTGRAQQPVDPARSNRGEERHHIEANHHALPGMRGRERVGRPSGHEAVRRRVDRDGTEQFVENLALQGTQARLGRLDEPSVEHR